MSINILQFPKKVHTIHDDVESVFWVFYYNALHYFQLSSKTKHLGSVKLFDEQEAVIQDNDRVTYMGGTMKLGFLAGRTIEKIKFKSTPITKALRQFANAIRKYYKSPINQPVAAVSDSDSDSGSDSDSDLDSDSDSEDETAQASAEKHARKLEMVDELIKIFDNILTNKKKPRDWSTRFTRAVEDQFPRESVMDAHRRAAAADLRDIEAQASVSTGTSRRGLTGDGESSSMLPPDYIPDHRGSTSGAGSSTSPGTLSGSTMQVPSGSRTTSRSSSLKRRISDRGGEAEEEGQAELGRRSKKEKKGKQVARTSSGRYVTRSHDKKKMA